MDVLLLQPARDLVKAVTEAVGDKPPVACHICSDEFAEAYNHESNVFHGKPSPTEVLGL